MSEERTRAPRGLLIAAAVCFVLAIPACATAAAGGASLVGFLGDLGDAIPMGSEATFVAESDGEALILLTGPSACLVTDDQGVPSVIENFSGSGNSTFTVNGQNLEIFQSFDTEAGRTYRVTCGALGGGTFAVMEVPSIFVGNTLARSVAGLFGGIGLFLLSILLLIIGLISRARFYKRRSEALAAPTSSPPGHPGVPAPVQPTGFPQGPPTEASPSPGLDGYPDSPPELTPPPPRPLPPGPREETR